MARWKRTRTAKDEAALRRRARAAAQPYLAGQKVMRYESPQMIAQHGRAPWPPKKAGAQAYGNVLRSAHVEDRYPTYSLHQHRSRKADASRRSRMGGTWTLRKANVGRDRTSGQFTPRRGRS